MCAKAWAKWFDRCGDFGKCNGAVGVLLQRLRLNAAEHGRTATLPAIGVGHLPDDVLVTSFAMRHQRREITLRAGREKESGFFMRYLGGHGLQAIGGGVVAPHVVAYGRHVHRGEHAWRWAGDGVTAQVDHFAHASPPSKPRCTISAARSTERVFCKVSSHSLLGTESCTIPAPACA